MVVFMIDIDVALVNGLGYTLHWQRRRQYRSSGSGFIIDTSRRVILTNAHCIEWHAQVKVQQRGQDTKYLARVVSVGWEADCAVLTVEAAGNWAAGQGKGTLEFSVSICAACFLYTAAKEVDDDSDEEQEKISDLREAAFTEVQLSKKVPHLEEHVLCVGFPVGGDTISVTSGVVSRVEVMTYAQTCSELLGIQIDAAINSGNSGGPAFNANGECLGMAFQSLSSDQAENIGYVIPTVVIMHFLSDLLKHNGTYTGFPTLGIETQTMENAQLREAFGMTAKQKGLLVNRIAPTCAVAKVLQLGDVLLSFDKEPIANDGTIMFRKPGPLEYGSLRAHVAFLHVLQSGPP
ncbi:DEGP9 [Symbiodinium microadriaticum]|nr:DEGP9 [Symbiodinium microadriaticum]